MNNTPEVKVGVVAVSRDCFPETLSVNRRKALMKAYTEKYGSEGVYECPVCIVESEIHMVQALEDVKNAGCNALVVYLGNFGPEISETLLAKHFDGPAMFIAAAEESGDDLVGGRGDAYCGMLNASYNLKLREIKAYIPENPVGDAEDCADRIHEFIPIARALVGLKDLKIISFGPRPLNFLACNAPIKRLYDLGVEIEENSELDLFEAFNKHAGDERIPGVVLRTSLITGLPYEDEAAFEELCDFLGEQKLQRVGAFPYSPEEGTPAAKMLNRVDTEEAQRRAELVLEIQTQVMDEFNDSRMGDTVEVLCDGYDVQAMSYVGRSYAESPGIDGCIFFTAERDVEPGDFVMVRITGAMDGDLTGEAVEELSEEE